MIPKALESAARQQNPLSHVAETVAFHRTSAIPEDKKQLDLRLESIESYLERIMIKLTAELPTAAPQDKVQTRRTYLVAVRNLRFSDDHRKVDKKALSSILSKLDPSWVRHEGLSMRNGVAMLKVLCGEDVARSRNEVRGVIIGVLQAAGIQCERCDVKRTELLARGMKTSSINDTRQ